MNRNLMAVLGLVATLVAGGCEQGTERPASTDGVGSSAELIENPSITVYPVDLAGPPEAGTAVAEVVGVFLERGGIRTVEIAPVAFHPDPAHSAGEQARAFGAFVADEELTTDYALFASYIGAPATGVEEIRGFVVDRTGAVQLEVSQRPGDAAFDKVSPDCPMDCCVLLTECLRAPLKLDDPMRDDAPEGKLAQRLRDRGSVPTDEEFGSIQDRTRRLCDGHAEKTLLVYPARVGDTYCLASAQRLVGQINERRLMRAAVADAPLEFSSERAMNQQKTLWTGARSAQALIRANQPDADYVMAVDFLMDRTSGHVGGVHTFVLEPDGDWAIVDFQNSHHRDFRRIKPHGRDGCCDLAVARLASYLD